MKLSAKLGMVIAIIAVLFVTQHSATFAADRVSYEQYLIQSLKDENIGRRASAAMLLGEKKTIEAINPLVEMLKHEDDYRVRIVAAMALYKIGDPNILPVLEKIAKKEKNKTAKRVMYGIVNEIKTNNFAAAEN
ncbi:HEAT repeat domain-containing protein [candidate division KSB1 bacterium]|nr:HEAT repeat domain-containing protein [candidate division KSB1 bacterium]